MGIALPKSMVELIIRHPKDRDGEGVLDRSAKGIIWGLFRGADYADRHADLVGMKCGIEAERERGLSSWC